jgi:uncharacterized membrane protein
VVGYTFAGCGINAIPTQEEKAKAAWSEVLAEHFLPGADNRDELPDKLVVM